MINKVKNKNLNMFVRNNEKKIMQKGKTQGYVVYDSKK
jgi:hypothetical protein